MTRCPHALVLSHKEYEGLDWVRRTMERIIQKGPAHPSYELAQGAIEALGKIVDYGAEVHGKIHEVETKARDLREAFSKLTTMEVAQS